MRGGDLNLQVEAPRGPEEVADAAILQDTWARAGSRPLDSFPQTYRKGEARSSIDAVVVPARGTTAWTPKLQWRRALSDHAINWRPRGTSWPGRPAMYSGHDGSVTAHGDGGSAAPIPRLGTALRSASELGANASAPSRTTPEGWRVGE